MRKGAIVVTVAVAAIAAWLLWRDSGSATSPTASRDHGDRETSAEGRPTLAAANVSPPPVEELGRDVSTSARPVLAAGTIVDESSRPVAGAEVVATIAGKVTGRTQSAADGRFEVALLPPSPDALHGVLEIRKSGRGAWRHAYVGPDSIERVDYGRIVIASLHVLSVRTLREGKPAAGADVVAGDAANAPAAMVLRSGQSDASGRMQFEGLYGPKVSVWAAAVGTGRAYRDVQLPAADVVDLELPDDRVVTVHVKHGLTGDPIAGAEVHLGGGGTLPFPQGRGCLPPLPDLRTDTNGNVVARGLPSGYLPVVARAPGLAMRNQGLMVERVSIAPDGADATVALWPYRTVRLPVAESGAGAPPDGTVLDLRRYQPLPGYDVGQPLAKIEGGQLVLESFPPGFDWGHVVSPDGRWAGWKVPWDKDLGEPVEFRRIYDVAIQLVFRDGGPAAGEYLAAILRPRGRRQPVRTDSDGRITFERCVGESVTVLWTSVESGFGMPLGSDRPIEIALRIHWTVEPGLPTGLQVTVPDLDPSRPGTNRQIAGEIQEDPEASVIRFRWLPMPGGDAPPVTVRADGFPETTATPRRGEGNVWSADVDLQPGATLRARVRPPEGGRYFLKLEQWTGDPADWYFINTHPGYEAGRVAVDGVHSFAGLGPGRYRVTDHNSEVSSQPVELRPGDVVDVDLDLASTVVVKGRVQVPDGESPAYVSLQVQGRDYGSVSRANPVYATPDGTFEFRAVRGERLALVGRHPLLRPSGDPVAFVAGADTPVLSFVPGPQVVFRIEGSDLTTPAPDPRISPPWSSPVHIRFWKPEGNDPDVVNSTIGKQGVFRAGAPGAGTWNVSIEQYGVVPIDIEKVVLGTEATDLGTLQQSPGATLTVRVLTGGRTLPAQVSVKAERVGPRPYAVWAGRVAAGDPPTATMKGLGPGQFRVLLQDGMGRGAVLGETMVESSGTGSISVDVSLR